MSKRIPESYYPSLATSRENMASNSERMKEKTRKFQIVYVGRTNLMIRRCLFFLNKYTW